MSYPQSTPGSAIRDRQDYWRLFTPLDSSGDVYESDASASGFALGPLCDIHEVRIFYFDPQEADRVQSVLVTPQKTIQGRIDARATVRYPSGQPARILITPGPSVLVPPAGWRPPPIGVGDAVSLIPPSIDLYQYFDGGVPAQSARDRREYRFETLLNLGAGVINWFLVPFYGRTDAEVFVKNLNFPLQPAITVSLYGLHMSNLNGASLADDGYGGSLLVSQAGIAAGTSARLQIQPTAAQNRAIDYLGLAVDPGAFAFADFSSVSLTLITADVT